MEIIEASELHFKAWLHLCKQLWPDLDEVHLSEMKEIIASENAVAFLRIKPGGEAVGFVKIERYLNPPQNYGYIDGWFMLPDYRRQGFGGQLLGALEEWILHHNISLCHSDITPEEYPPALRPMQNMAIGSMESFRFSSKNLKCNLQVL